MKILSKVSMIAVSAIALIFGLTETILAATQVDLGTADSFAILAGTGITNTGSTKVSGDVGTFPTTSETGFGSVTFLSGANHAGDTVTQGAKTDLVTAYNNAAGQTPVATVPTELGGTTKTAGIYDSAAGTFGITGTLTLDAQGNPNAVFIFKMASTLITASDSVIVLANSAQSCNVFWQVGSSATLGTNSIFKGNILASASITLTTGANVRGRVLARDGAVTLDGNTVTRATCVSDTSNFTSEDASDTANSDIKVKKTASDYKLQSGPDKVTFTYKVTNEGDIALTDISLKDDKCDDVNFKSGDDNDNDALDTDEEWKYTCKKTVKKTETNKATAKGTANGIEVRATDKVTVTVSTPTLPNAGFVNNNSFWNKVFSIFSF